MIARLIINLFILSVFLLSHCFVAWAEMPQVCIDAERQINQRIKINLFIQCIQSGKLSDNEYSITYAKRGIVYEHLGEKKLAIQDYNRAIQRNSTYIYAYIRRGDLYCDLGEFKQAIQDYEKAIELRPNNRKAYNNLAWLLVTCEDQRYRDGERALKLIQTAVQLSNGDDPEILDTLAAVYAEFGQFGKAIETQSKALKISEERGEEELSNKLREVLSDYKLNRKNSLKSVGNIFSVE